MKKEKNIAWPDNGLIYVESSGACTYKYNARTPTRATRRPKRKNCGTVYVSGTYSKSLTVAGENEVIVNGSLYPTSVEGKLGSEHRRERRPSG